MTEEILGQFLGDESFPVDWASATEQDFFWVYDDLHIPHPVSPMFFDIGGWWLSCDHMFRRFGTPFAVDWLAKNVNGYVYTTAIPADPDLRIEGTEYSSRYGARVPRDRDYAATMGAYLDTVLPVYGQHFADWWHDRLVPEMQRNFAFLEGELDRADGMSLAETATLLEERLAVGLVEAPLEVLEVALHLGHEAVTPPVGEVLAIHGEDRVEIRAHVLGEGVVLRDTRLVAR